jgi:hypothetical protein
MKPPITSMALTANIRASVSEAILLEAEFIFVPRLGFLGPRNFARRYAGLFAVQAANNAHDLEYFSGRTRAIIDVHDRVRVEYQWLSR